MNETNQNLQKSGGAAALRYVLITPARNEATFIEQTIRAVAAQTVTPLRWVIVSDGSTDGTDEIVQRYAAQHSWIELVRMPERTERHFAGKILAFNAGYERMRGLNYDVIASLDADITFDPEYFVFLLGKLAENPQLGLVGTPFEDQGVSYDYRFVSIEHVSGACQVFRRECFEAIGGYIPMKGGGVDHVAVLSSRMKGWKTRTFTDKKCVHHRVMGTAKHTGLASKFNIGKLDYALGGHPLWELFRGAYQMTKKPFVLGGGAILAGYFSSMFSGVKRPIPDELVRFRRGEQMVRLKRFLLRQRGVSNA